VKAETKTEKPAGLRLHNLRPRPGARHRVKRLVNLSDLKDFKSGSVVNEESLRAANLVRGNFDGIKILGGGELKHGLMIEAEKVSASAREKVEKAGGSIAEVKTTSAGGAHRQDADGTDATKPKRTKAGKK
jgi:ribosomal protein L15